MTHPIINLHSIMQGISKEQHEVINRYFIGYILAGDVEPLCESLKDLDDHKLKMVSHKLDEIMLQRLLDKSKMEGKN